VLNAGYKITDLGTLGGMLAEATALNDRGQVVGWSFTANNEIQRAFVASHGKMKSLGALLGGDSAATGINDRGQIVGYARTASLSEIELFLDSDGRMKSIGKSSEFPYVVSINDRDQIIGFSSQDGDAELKSGGRLTDLGSLNGLGSVAMGSNNHGAVVGYSYLKLPTIEPFPAGSGSVPVAPPIGIINNGMEHPFVYQHGHMTDLGTLGGTSAEATAVNNHGDVVGWSDTTGDGAQHAFLDRNGQMIDLGTLGGSDASATAINDHDQVVGWSYVGGYTRIDQFLYSNGSMVDLSALYPTLSQVVGINNRGQIAAVGTNAKGEEVALLLTPTTKG
jgi:probable HAF family extracellular repeat protein